MKSLKQLFPISKARKSSIILTLLVLLIGAALVLTVCGKKEKALTEINFYDNLESARKVAAEQDHPLIIEFYKEDCPNSKMMDDSTFSNKIVIGMAEKMVFAKINADADSALAKDYRVSFYPTFIVAESSGKEIDRMVGYYPPADFFNEVQLLLQGNETLEDYQLRVSDDPGRVDYYLIIAEKYKYRSDWSKALEYYSDVTNLAGDDYQYEMEMARFGIADVYCEMGDYSKAAKAYEEFLNQFPTSEKAEDADRKLPYCLAKTGEYQKAKLLFDEYLVDYPHGLYRQWVQQKIDNISPLIKDGN